MALQPEYSHKVYKTYGYPLFDIRMSEHRGKFILHVSFDAIVIDMTSFEILFGEWIALYNDKNPALPTLNISYRDYQLQYERLRGSALFERAWEYWLQKVDDYTLEVGLRLASHPARIDITLFNRLPLHPQVEQIIGDFTVLRLFNYRRQNSVSMNEQLSAIHRSLLNDVDNNLFDGIDVQRLLKQRRNLPANTVIARLC